jgi:hypothetical protein
MKNIVISLMIFCGLNSFCSDRAVVPYECSYIPTDKTEQPNPPVWKNYRFKDIYPAQDAEKILTKQEALASKIKTPLISLDSLGGNRLIEVSPIESNSNIKFLLTVKDKETKNILYQMTSKNKLVVPSCETVEILACGENSDGKQEVLRLSAQTEDITGDVLQASTLSYSDRVLAAADKRIKQEKKLQSTEDKAAVEKILQDLQEDIARPKPSSFITTKRMIAFASFLALAAAIMYNFSKIQAEFAKMMSKQ